MKEKYTQLDAALTSTLERRRRNSTLRNLTTNTKESVDFSSNDFVSLASSADLRKTFLCELERNPQFTLGSGGSRLLDGNSSYAEELEKDIAAFHNAPAGLLCNAGFDANVGIFSCLPQPGDAIIYDEYIHASVYDGMRHSRADTRLPFTHNNVSALRQVLQDCKDSDHAVGLGQKSVFVALEAIYSMDGDIAPLREMVDAVEELLPHGNGHIIVDEAHATGVMGPKGRGLVCDLGLEDRILVRLHTFGKALACNGGLSTFSLDNTNIIRYTNNATSDNPLHAFDSPLSCKLRALTDIHNIHVLSNTRRHPRLLHPPHERLHRTTSQTTNSERPIPPLSTS